MLDILTLQISSFLFLWNGENELSTYTPKRVHIPPLASTFPSLPSFVSQVSIEDDSLQPSALNSPAITHLTVNSHSTAFYMQNYDQLISNLPPNLTHLSMKDNDDFQRTFDINLDILPSALTHLVITMRIEPSLDNLPSSLEQLTITNGTYKYKSFDNLPPNLLRLRLEGYTSSCSLDNLPPLLTHLHLHFYSNSAKTSLDNLPNSLINLKVLGDFNSTVDYLPPSITHLELGENFRRPIDHLPKALLHLALDLSFNESVDNLPPRLQSLIIGTVEDKGGADDKASSLNFSTVFNQSVDNLPSTLKTLKIFTPYGLSKLQPFDQPIDHLPPNLETLVIHSPLFCHPYDNLPTSLKVLKIGFMIRDQPYHLPPTLKVFKFVNFVNAPVNLDFLPDHLDVLACHGAVEYDMLPSSITQLNFFSFFPLLCSPNLTHLALPEIFNESVDYLPHSLEVLHFGLGFNQPVNHLPPNLYVLRFGRSFNQPIDHLPQTLKILLIPSIFDQPVDQLPPGLTTLHLGAKFNHSVDNLPPALENLLIEGRFNQPVDHLPQCLQVLYIIYQFQQPINHLPQSLRVLKLGSMYKESLLNLPTSTVKVVWKPTNMAQSAPPCNGTIVSKYDFQSIFISPWYSCFP